MAKIKTQYTCQNCAFVSPKWLGRCPGCEQWSTFVEETVKPMSAAAGQAGVLAHAPLITGARDPWVYLDPFDDAVEGEEPRAPRAVSRRLNTGIDELNRVLGGGLVPDSFVLIGGDPGIGKSTLLLQMCDGLKKKYTDIKILYVSGEESIEQIRSRAVRLGIKGDKQVLLASETVLERVHATVRELRPQVLIMDSLQTFSSGSLESGPGSVSQVREVAARLMAIAKSEGLAIFLVGHVTKEGSIAGPKVVEHMVDTVLYFEGEGTQSYRLLRTVKNRFGSTHELGVFEMDGEGLREVGNPSALFLGERQHDVSGTAISVPLAGSRPLLVELQALVTPCSYGTPRRTAVGLEQTRLSLLAAILEKHAGLPLGRFDLFFNVAGGLRLTDPACDLAAAVAIWSSQQDFSIDSTTAWLGELGLTGEVRRVAQLDVRLQEARRLGFKRIVVPRSSLKGLSARASQGVVAISRVEEIPAILGLNERRPAPQPTVDH